MASDGVWDNLYDNDVQSCIKKYMYKSKSSGFFSKVKNNIRLLTSMQGAADCLSLEAERLGNTSGYLSPFAKEAQKHYMDFQPRGKADDVTVIVAQIHSKDDGLPFIDINKVTYSAQKEQGTGYTLPYYEARAKKRKSQDGPESWVVDMTDESLEFDQLADVPYGEDDLYSPLSLINFFN